jgi:hypothetical protein
MSVVFFVGSQPPGTAAGFPFPGLRARAAADSGGSPYAVADAGSPARASTIG